MSDTEETQPTDSVVDEALSKIPGLAENVPSESEDSQDEEDGAPDRAQPEDSEAVQAALDQIPGLKDRMGDS